ncbi:MAG: PilN domain-containing protein [Acidobacteriota bacterium]
MLRTNLSTRPFYNERALHLLLAAVAAVVVAISVVNAVYVVRLSRHNTELTSQTGAERAEAQRLLAEAARIRGTIDKDELAMIVNAAQEANALIDQRTFSWTEFFNRIEATLPPDVMLTSVRPTIKGGLAHVDIGVLGRRAEDVDEFMEKLEATGAFQDIVPATQDRTEEGLYRAAIESVYTSPGNQHEAAAAKAPPASAAAPKAPGGRR